MKAFRIFLGIILSICLLVNIVFEFLLFKENGKLAVSVVCGFGITFVCLITVSVALFFCGDCKSDVKIKKIKKLTETFQKLENIAGGKTKSQLANSDIELFKSYANAMADI